MTECSRCGEEKKTVKQRPHSMAEVGRPDNPYLCAECDSEISR